MKSELALGNWTEGNIDPRVSRKLGTGILVDCFCGGGGTSSGITEATGRGPHVAINHDIPAILMHQANHPETKHMRQSIYEIDPWEATDGRPVDLGWFSPDCTHFSKAKGGKPVKKHIRDMANVVHKWVDRLGISNRPLIIMLENVWEFTKWGPLIRRDGKWFPDKMREGEYFNIWVKRLERAGYVVEWRKLKACDFGAPTSRERLLLVARCDGDPIVWPEPTHGPGRANPYRTAAECIDWSISCPSIFERKRPLADNTLRRIATGIQRFVIDAEEPFIIPLTHQGSADRVYGIDKPVPTVTCANRGEMAIVNPSLVQVTHTKNKPTAHDVREPLRTITTAKGGEFALVTPILDRQFGRSKGAPADEPMATVMPGGSGKTAVVCPTLIQTGYGEREGQAPRSLDIEKPLGTVVAGGGKHALVTAFMAQHNTGATGHPVSKPLSTIVHRGTQQQLVSSNLVKLRGTGMANPVDEPLHTISAQGLHHAEVRAFMIKYYNVKGQWADPRDPMHTITTKDRMGLVTVTIKGEEYVIVDIGMRMLTARELFNAQGFDPDYIIDPIFNGKPLTKTMQVAKCGNAVPKQWPNALIRANAPQLCIPSKEAA